MNGTAKKGAVNKAGTTCPSIQILLYYERNGYRNPDDRDAIIRKGLWEWLLASKKGHDTTRSEQDKKKYGTYQKQGTEKQKELVILMANLIGGDMDETDR